MTVSCNPACCRVRIGTYNVSMLVCMWGREGGGGLEQCMVWNILIMPYSCSVNTELRYIVHMYIRTCIVHSEYYAIHCTLQYNHTTYNTLQGTGIAQSHETTLQLTLKCVLLIPQYAWWLNELEQKYINITSTIFTVTCP